MSILVVGSIALDSISSPAGRVTDALGGSATYFSYAASFYAPVRLVGVVGEDFPAAHPRLLKKRGIDLAGLETQPGRTFRWKGSYCKDLNSAETLSTCLNVFERFKPKIPLRFAASPYIFLANIDPELQLEVLNQMRFPKLTACDTMNLWIKIKRAPLLKLLKKIDIFVLNDAEARQLTGIDNLIKAGRQILRMGPRICLIKKGEHGAILFSRNEIFAVPAYPLEQVFDPTGAGDTFAGGFFGYLAKNRGGLSHDTLKKAVINGTVMASFTVENFSLNRLTRLTPTALASRIKSYIRITQLKP